MQHPEVPQDSHLVSSDVQAFFRAQGAPVTLELPIPDNASANRVVPVAGGNDIVFEDDSAIRQIAARICIHQCFGPYPYVAMLVQDLATHAQSLMATLPMKEPLLVQSWNFVPASSFADTWFFCVDNPAWGNNAEASSSRGIRMPRLTLISSPHSVSPPNQLNVQEHINTLEPVSQINLDQEASDGCVVDMELDSPPALPVKLSQVLLLPKREEEDFTLPLWMMRCAGAPDLEMLPPRITSSLTVSQEEGKVPPRNLCPFFCR
jgi:hypothetical protein